MKKEQLYNLFWACSAFSQSQGLVLLRAMGKSCICKASLPHHYWCRAVLADPHPLKYFNFRTPNSPPPQSDSQTLLGKHPMIPLVLCSPPACGHQTPRCTIWAHPWCPVWWQPGCRGQITTQMLAESSYSHLQGLPDVVFCCPRDERRCGPARPHCPSCKNQAPHLGASSRTQHVWRPTSTS